ncbi:thioredoxin family protein [Pseudofulvibacter geojedonensis]|uniref:Thioredoxin family protein n=1 Tax=Pseudofulvibacter geojedonensis TaxID=1123758 RepID=A0ABW3I1V3_9FLAO
MKRILVVVFLLVAIISVAQGKKDELHWETNFDKAKEISKKEKKPILIMFTGSDWCPPCKMLKADFFQSDKFANQANKFVLLMVDLPRNRDLVGEEQYKANMVINKKYGVRSIPVVMAVDANGGIIDKIKSYNSARDTAPHFKFIEKVLKKYSKG